MSSVARESFTTVKIYSRQFGVGACRASSIGARIADAKPQGTSRPTLTTTQPHFTQTDAGARDRHVLHDFVLPLAAWARHRLGMSLDDCGADDWQRSLRCTAELELE